MTLAVIAVFIVSDLEPELIWRVTLAWERSPPWSSW